MHLNIWFSLVGIIRIILEVTMPDKASSILWNILEHQNDQFVQKFLE